MNSAQANSAQTNSAQTNSVQMNSAPAHSKPTPAVVDNHTQESNRIHATSSHQAQLQSSSNSSTESTSNDTKNIVKQVPNQSQSIDQTNSASSIPMSHQELTRNDINETQPSNATPKVPLQGAHATALPPHPSLPFDIDKDQTLGHNVTSEHYQKFEKFCEKLSKVERFFASELRLHARLVEWNLENAALSIAIPPEIEVVLQTQHAQIKPLLNESFQQEVHLHMVSLDADQTYQTIETLSDFNKRQAAHYAIKEMQDALDHSYTKNCMEALKGEVIYIQPASLTRV